MVILHSYGKLPEGTSFFGMKNKVKSPKSSAHAPSTNSWAVAGSASVSTSCQEPANRLLDTKDAEISEWTFPAKSF